MKNIETILTEAGLELTDDQKTAINAAVKENYKTIVDYEKQTAKYSTLEGQYNTAKDALSKFDGVDVDALRKQVQDAQDALTKAENDAKAQLAARDYADAVKAQVDSLSFSSNAARKSFIADLTAKNLPLENGKLLGFDDYVAAYKESDAGAIVDPKAAGKAAKFTDPMNGGHSFQSPKDSEMEAKMRAAMGLKTKE